jgi:hypothetical protein
MWRHVATHPQAQRRVDPYYEWARATGFIHLFREGQERRFPVILELNGTTARDFARIDWGDTLRVPRMYREPPAGFAGFRFCSATVTQEFFSLVATNPQLRQAIRRVELSLPIDTFVGPIGMLGGPPPVAPGVVIGVIDDAIAFAHERFRNVDGTSRVQFFWNQDATPWTSGVAYGREFKKNGLVGIDNSMTLETHAGLVDEDAVYRRMRHLDMANLAHKPLAWRTGHGTHVMDIAAGENPAAAPADRPIIGVQLPVHATQDTSGAHFGRYALDGLWFILDRAERLAPAPPPAVVNISYGFIAGPHDGSSILEVAIDQMIALRPAPFAVVLPAGNSHLARCHARLQLAPLGRDTLPWRLQPEDYTPSYMEIWLPHRPAGVAAARVRLRIRPPGAAWSPWVNEGDSWFWQPGADVLCEAVYHNSVAPGRNRNMILIAAAPTAVLQANREVAPSGLWEIEIQNLGARAAVHAWIQRDDTPFGYPARGRQSYFDADDYAVYDDAGRDREDDNGSIVRRRNMINSISTGSNTVVVGGFHRKDWRAAKYSAGGRPIRPARGAPESDGPDAMAVSDDSVVHSGVLGAGTRSGSCVSMFGTSVAAPQITRWIADRMAAGQPFDRQAVSDFARVGAAPGYRTEANPPPGARPRPPRRRRGGGRIESPLRRLPRFER